MIPRLFLITMLTAALSACTSTSTDNAFTDVQQILSDRTQNHRIHWNKNSPADAAVAAEIQKLLAAELTPQAAVQIALLNNRSLQATYEDLSIAQADLVAAGLLRNPIFEADIRLPAAGAGGTGLELALVQDFIDLLYIPLRTQLASAALQRAKLRLAGNVIDLAGQTRAAFYDLQAAMQTQELRQQVVSATAAAYELAQRLRTAGNIRELDLHNERALYEQSKIDLRAAELQTLRARERLNTLMGLWGEQTQWTIAARLPDIPADDPPLDNLERTAITRSLDLDIARQQIIESGNSLGIAQPLALLGEFEAGATAEREPEGHWSVGPTFAIPIPLFNQGQPQVARAQAELRRARQNYYASAVAIRSQVRTARAALIAARETAIYHHKVLLPLRKKILDETLLQYNAMQIGAFQLLLAKQQQIETANAYIRALHAYWLARTELDQILSGRSASFQPLPDAAGSSPAPQREGH
jgi:cobalt-zinc-cadmium efflux system outer membrane protein